MSRELKRRAPLGLGRGSPGQSAADRRNSDASSSYLAVAPGVRNVALELVPLTNVIIPPGSPSILPEGSLTGIILRMQALETAHNKLLQALRDGQVINQDQPR